MVLSRHVLRVVFSFLFIGQCYGEPKYLVAPDLSDSKIIGHRVGLRPVRTGGMRLELEPIAKKFVIHDYGHGGAGISLSWGSANEAVKLMEQTSPSAHEPIAIIGAGIIGLCTAHELLARGYENITIYAKDFPPNTTSNVAVGFWGPGFLIDKGQTDEEKICFASIVEYSHKKLLSLACENPEFKGVRFLDIYELDVEGAPAESVVELNLNGLARNATCERRLMMGGCGYIEDLYNKAIEKGAKMETRAITTLADVMRFEEEIIFNCTGLGARELCNDKKLHPVRGQLIEFAPQEGFDYGLHKKGKPLFASIIPLADRIVVGGMLEEGQEECVVVPEACQAILENACAALCTP
jgi:D-amino-acid oxidase